MEYLVIIKAPGDGEKSFGYRISSLRCNREATADHITGILDGSNLTVFWVHDPPREK